MKATLSTILMAVLVATLSCCPRDVGKEDTTPIPEAQAQSVAPNRAEVFDEFYHKFYRDSTFQVSRIQFPLKGHDSNVINGDIQVSDHETEGYFVRDNQLYWKKDGWRFVTTMWEEHEDFYKTIEQSDTLVIERIIANYEFWIITSHFKPIDGKWTLVFYANSFN